MNLDIVTFIITCCIPETNVTNFQKNICIDIEKNATAMGRGLVKLTQFFLWFRLLAVKLLQGAIISSAILDSWSLLCLTKFGTSVIFCDWVLTAFFHVTLLLMWPQVKKWCHNKSRSKLRSFKNSFVFAKMDYAFHTCEKVQSTTRGLRVQI